MKQPITITNKAAHYISTKLHEHEHATGLRISLKKGGCSGQEYHFEYADQKQPLDEHVHNHGIDIFIDPGAFLNILGSTMDYQDDDPFSSGLVFINPNETDRCGCGKSVRFDIKPTTSI